MATLVLYADDGHAIADWAVGTQEAPGRVNLNNEGAATTLLRRIAKALARCEREQTVKAPERLRGEFQVSSFLDKTDVDLDSSKRTGKQHAAEKPTGKWRKPL